MRRADVRKIDNSRLGRRTLNTKGAQAPVEPVAKPPPVAKPTPVAKPKTEKSSFRKDK